MAQKTQDTRADRMKLGSLEYHTPPITLRTFSQYEFTAYILRSDYLSSFYSKSARKMRMENFA
jgi:hypothetical protein